MSRLSPSSDLRRALDGALNGSTQSRELPRVAPYEPLEPIPMTPPEPPRYVLGLDAQVTLELDDRSAPPAENAAELRERRFAALDRALDDPRSPIANLLESLEQRMLSGATWQGLRLWALREHAVSSSELRTLVDFVRTSWTMDAGRREDELRMRYIETYRAATEMAQASTDERAGAALMAVAAKALDGMSRLGLKPGVTVNVDARSVALGASAGGAGTIQTGALAGLPPPRGDAEITNRTRERTQRLLSTMRSRAERHAQMAERKIESTRRGPTEETVRDASLTPGYGVGVVR